MNLINYFDFEKNDNFNIYRLKPENIENFLHEITLEFRQCYIADNMLKEKAKKNKMLMSKFLEEFILPSKGNIKACDFGEMLSYFFVIEHYDFKGIMLFSPRKWQWKQDKNKAMPFSDAVCFHREDKTTSSKHDFVVCVESKMRATKSDINIHRIQEAIEGANTDKISRLTKTLLWLRAKYAKDGDMEMRTYIERYLEPVERNTYKKIFKAFTILDKEFENIEISQPIINVNDISIIIITMDNLKDIYERNLKWILESV